MEQEKDIKKLRLLALLGSFFRDLFSLDHDKADDRDTIEYIKKNSEFRGTNLWILIFAIFIASIGLNMNSTAVVIGAMLISPLMGPILGIGLGIGINDLELIKKALKNLGIATGIAVATSTLYFSISPLSDAQSELLSRTTPTIWDVLIAFFGGLAGIVAGSRKEKSNAIPGVAIATALMPPLCTAGYGLAIGNMYYFFGAFYLYFINSVFISVATVLIVRFLNYPKKQFEEERVGRRVRAIITFFVLITLVPSIYLGYMVVKRSIFERNAFQFVNDEFQFENCRIINKQVSFDTKPHRIEVSLFGEHVEEADIEGIRRKLSNYDLADAELVVFQGYEADVDEAALESSIRSSIVEQLYQQNQELIQSKDEKIRLLETQLIQLKLTSFTSVEVASELKALYPTIKQFSLNKTLLTSMDSMRQDTVFIAYMSFTKRPYRSDIRKIEGWLKARVKEKSVKVVVE